MDGKKHKKKEQKAFQLSINYDNNLRLLQNRFPLIYKQLHKERGNSASFHSVVTKDETHNIEIKLSNKKSILLYGHEDSALIVNKVISDWNFQPYDIIFFLGMGIGYLPIEAIERCVGKPRFVIIEPCVEIFLMALRIVDLQTLFMNDRIDIFIGKEINVAQIIERYQDIIPIGRNQIIVHSNYDKLFAESIGLLKQQLTERIQTVRDIWFTTKQNGRRMLENTIRNLPSLFAGIPFSHLRDLFRHVPAICIAAGPSLDESIEHLRRLKDNSLLIACDSAVHALVSAGISPHVVVTTDIFESNLVKLKPHFEFLRDTLLIFGIESNPDCIRLYLGPKRAAVSAYSKMVYWLDQKLNLQCQFPGMSSVSHMALFTALALGADPIVMVGMDLAFIDGKSHAHSSAFYHCLDNQKILQIPCNKGWGLSSSPQFVADRLLIENVVGRNLGRFINTSIKGAYVKGAKLKSLSEVTDTNPSIDAGIYAILNSIELKPAADESTAGSIMKELSDQFAGFQKKCRAVGEKVSFELMRIEKEIDSEIDTLRLIALLDQCEEFMAQHVHFIDIVKEFMLSELQENFKQKEILAANPDHQTEQMLIKKCTLIKNHLDILERGMVFLIFHIHNAVGWLNDRPGNRTVGSESDRQWATHFELAHYYEKSGVLWMTVREYESCIRLNPHKIEAYYAIIKTYLQNDLLMPASSVVQRAIRLIGPIPEIQFLADEIERHLDRLMEDIKQTWMQGDMSKARKLLYEYMMLRADDPQANALKLVIADLDQALSADWANETADSLKILSPRARFDLAAAKIDGLDYEPAIGILEGLIAEFPQSRAALRERIGDCRMLQKDFASAQWNYAQAIGLTPNRTELTTKIAKAKESIEASP